MKQQNILVISDTLFSHTGVSNQVKHLCRKLIKMGHNVVSVGPIPNPTAASQSYTYDTGETVKCYAAKTHNGQPVFDDMQQISAIIKQDSINVVLLFTDPHRYLNVWNNTNYFHTHHIPIVYVSVWDTYLIPAEGGIPHYNRSIYENCDVVACISKQTEWFTNAIMEDLPAGYAHYLCRGVKLRNGCMNEYMVMLKAVETAVFAAILDKHPDSIAQKASQTDTVLNELQEREAKAKQMVGRFTELLTDPELANLEELKGKLRAASCCRFRLSPSLCLVEEKRW